MCLQCDSILCWVAITPGITRYNPVWVPCNFKKVSDWEILDKPMAIAPPSGKELEGI